MKAWVVSISLLALPSMVIAQDKEALAGKIWGLQEGSFVDVQDMLTSVKDKKYILIGERHGHHAHQGREAFLIGALAEAGRYPTVAFEMLTHEQTATVEDYRQRAPEYALGLGIELNWADSNWPSWNYYNPIFDAAFTTKADIVGADLTDAEQQAAIESRNSVSSANEASFSYYKTQMSEAHCGLIEDARAEELAALQIARDQSMAAQMQDGSDPNHGALLVVGSSHVRKSTGVPQYLPDESFAVIALVATDAQVAEFTTPYQDVVSGDLNDFDYLWFTPPHQEKSFCDRIKPSTSKE